MSVRRPDLLPVDDPVVAVAFGAGGDRGEIGTRAGFTEQLAGDQVATLQRLEVLRRHLGRGVCRDRRGHHAETDREDRLVGELVGGLERPVGPDVVRSQPATAELDGPVDPAEPGIEALGRPRAGCCQLFDLGLGVALLDDADEVVALAPHELGGDRRLGRRVRVEERPRLHEELVERRCGLGGGGFVVFVAQRGRGDGDHRHIPAHYWRSANSGLGLHHPGDDRLHDGQQ